MAKLVFWETVGVTNWMVCLCKLCLLDIIKTMPCYYYYIVTYFKSIIFYCLPDNWDYWLILNDLSVPQGSTPGASCRHTVIRLVVYALSLQRSSPGTGGGKI